MKVSIQINGSLNTYSSLETAACPPCYSCSALLGLQTQSWMTS